MKDPQLPAALMWHFGSLAGVTYYDGAIDQWPVSAGPVPTDAQQAQILLDYQNGPILTSATEAARKASLSSSIDADSVIAQLRVMNATDFNTWWTANVTTLAQANTVLKRLAWLALRSL